MWTYAAGESIFEQGDDAHLVYVIKSGNVDVVRVLADGGEEPLNRLGPDQYFGELGPFLGFPRSASVRADDRRRAHRLQPPRVPREGAAQDLTSAHRIVWRSASDSRCVRLRSQRVGARSDIGHI